MFVRCLISQAATMNREKGARHNQFLDKWLKEFGWLQTRGSGDDISMICKDCTKAGKKNAFTSGCKNFQRSALVCHESGGSQKFGKSVASAKNFKAASDNASKVSDDSLVKQMRTAYWLLQEDMPLQRAPSPSKVVTAYA